MIDYKTLCDTIATWKSGYRQPTGSFQAIQFDSSEEIQIAASEQDNNWEEEDIPVRRPSPSEEPTKEIPTDWNDEDEPS